MLEAFDGLTGETTSPGHEFAGVVRAARHRCEFDVRTEQKGGVGRKGCEAMSERRERKCAQKGKEY